MTRSQLILATIVVGTGVAAAVQTGGFLLLQSSTPGVAQTGNWNITGTARAGQFSGSAASLTNVPSAALTGTIADARLSNNVANLSGTETFSGQKTFSAAPSFGANFQVTSTNVVTSLNADLLDGLEATDFIKANPALWSTDLFHLTGTTVSGVISGTATGNGAIATGVRGMGPRGVQGFSTVTPGWGGYFYGGYGVYATNLGQQANTDSTPLALNAQQGLKIAFDGNVENTAHGMGVARGTSDLMIQSTLGTGDIVLGSGANNTFDEWMRIQSSNVGIGTATPGARLDVAGTLSGLKIWLPFSNDPSLMVGAGDSTGYATWQLVTHSYLENDNDSLSKVAEQSWSVNTGGDFLGASAKKMALYTNNSVKTRVNPGTSSTSGFVDTNGPTGWAIVSLESAEVSEGADLGGIGVANYFSQYLARIFVRANGSSRVEATHKNFMVPDPDDLTQDIWYQCIEGPEAAMYTRGTGELINGEARIVFPDHFRKLAASHGITVTLQPRSRQSRGLGCDGVSTGGFTAFELKDGKGSYSFDWEAKAIRQGYEDYQVLVPRRKRDPRQ